MGFEVIHSPTHVRSPVGSGGTGWPYRWIFRTEIRAIDRPLTIVQFGMCAWDGEKWILPATNHRYNAGVLNQKTFKEWYARASARIDQGNRPSIPRTGPGVARVHRSSKNGSISAGTIKENSARARRSSSCSTRTDDAPMASPTWRGDLFAPQSRPRGFPASTFLPSFPSSLAVQRARGRNVGRTSRVPPNSPVLRSTRWSS